MKHKFFTIPIFTPEVHEAAQNQFFAQHSIANVEKHYDANKKQGRPHVSSANERVWDDRLQVSLCKY